MEAARHPGNDQRAHQAGAVSHSDRKVRDTLAVQVSHHARVGDQIVRQHHQIRGGVRHGGMRLAALGDARPGAAQRLDDQLRERASAVDADRRRPPAGLAAVGDDARPDQFLDEVAQAVGVAEPALPGVPLQLLDRRRRPHRSQQGGELSGGQAAQWTHQDGAPGGFSDPSPCLAPSHPYGCFGAEYHRHDHADALFARHEQSRHQTDKRADNDGENY